MDFVNQFLASTELNLRNPGVAESNCDAIIENLFGGGDVQKDTEEDDFLLFPIRHFSAKPTLEPIDLSASKQVSEAPYDLSSRARKLPTRSENIFTPSVSSFGNLTESKFNKTPQNFKRVPKPQIQTEANSSWTNSNLGNSSKTASMAVSHSLSARCSSASSTSHSSVSVSDNHVSDNAASTSSTSLGANRVSEHSVSSVSVSASHAGESAPSSSSRCDTSQPNARSTSRGSQKFDSVAAIGLRPLPILRRPTVNGAGSDTGGSSVARGSESVRSVQFSASVQSKTVETNESKALVEGRGYARGEVGMVALFQTSPKMIICQIPDSPMYNRTITQLNVFSPSEIIVPVTVTDGLENNHLTETIRRSFPNVPLNAIPRKFFSDQLGLQYVKKLAMPKCASVHHIISQKYYALAAVSALWRYVEYSQNSYYAPKSLHISFQGAEMSTFIDSQAAIRMELVTSQLGPKGPSLFNILNCCKTLPGERMLRASLLQPTRLVGLIQQRHEAVQELLGKAELFIELRGAISNFGDVGKVLTGCIQIPKSDTSRAVEQRINLVIGIKQALTLLHPLKESIKEAMSPLFRVIYNDLLDTRFEKLLEVLSEIISDDAKITKGSAAMKLQRCFAIKSGVNQVLDISRKAYCEIVEDMSAYVAELANEHNLNLKLTSSAVRGFHIQLIINGKGNKDIELPAEFTQVQRGKNVISFTTDTLMLLDRRSCENLAEINKMSSKILETLLSEIRNDISCLYNLSEAVSLIDLITSFAHIASSRDRYLCPSFEDKVAILQGRHPILEAIGVAMTANDTFLSASASGMIITGPNMGGKTTYLLQVGTLQVMAQIGCFVPAEFAVFKPVDQILIRMGSTNTVEENASTFENEMMESSFILQNATSDSLVLIDELCRSTSREEGAPIAFAILEKLRKTGAFMIVATHEKLLTRLADIYPDINNYHMESEEIRAKDGTLHLRHSHRLVPGVVALTEYGLRLASSLNLPPSVRSEAWMVAGKLANCEKPTSDVSMNCKLNRLKMAFGDRLLLLARQRKSNQITEDAALDQFCRMKQELVAAVNLQATQQK
ncbi:mutS protein homolog 4-like isoform X3 [Artemia franciscana]|uniref:mutS protein homolog 4-like isoform X3 n=1 Tax=Artemia franciscana TaxID=6661 RepID=UPI0032DBF097